MTTHSGPLEFRMVGELEVRRDGVAVDLPPSKKTRALLAYLVLTQRMHRREALCSLLWDVTDDPRGALRWSLSRLRRLVDGDAHRRIQTDGSRVGFEPHGATVDLLEMRRSLRVSELEHAPLSELTRWSERCDSEILEGLDLPDFDAFQAWLVGEREETRRLRSTLLQELVRRSADDPARGLPHALAWSRVDPMCSDARVAVLRFSLATGKHALARSHYQSALRTFGELDPQKAAALTSSWHALRHHTHSAVRSDPPPASDAPPAVGSATLDLSRKLAAMLPLTGRDDERTLLAEALREVTRTRRARLIVVTGEPGIGKSRLLDEQVLESRRSGHAVLHGAAYEGEAGRPYGAFIDALRRLPDEAVDARARELLRPLLVPGSGEESRSREALFSGVVEVLTDLAAHSAPVLVVLEDAHWLDEGSAELLHHAVRMQRDSPVLFLLSARDAELLDSRCLVRVLRSLRRDVEQSDLPLRPLTEDATRALVGAVDRGIDARAVHLRCGGNPLYALELARAGEEPTREGTLADAVRDRIDRLSPEACDVIRWCAVLGPAVDPDHLTALSSMDPEMLLIALEELQRHALLRSVDGRHTFAHEVVRQVVYAGLSQPRRVLMHRRAAETLAARHASAMGQVDGAQVAVIARHAGIAQDHALATSAHIAAGRRCLKLLAGHDAASLARRGMRHAAQLPEPERARALLELHDIQLWARRPEDAETFCAEVQALAETAMQHGCQEHARLGFHMQSYVRWERGDWNAARQKIRLAEEAASAGGAEGHAEALAQAARCEALLERDMGLAESLLREAQGRVAQGKRSATSLADAEGLLKRFMGEVDEAERLLQRARSGARARKDRYAELQSLLSHCELLYDAGRLEAALSVALDACGLAERAREGSELPYARAMAALSRFTLGDDGAQETLWQALQSLREVDAKHRATFAMTRTAAELLRRDRPREALVLAREAAEFAEVLQWPSESVMASVALARAQAALDDHAGLAHTRKALRTCDPQRASAHARRVLSEWLEQE